MLEIILAHRSRAAQRRVHLIDLAPADGSILHTLFGWRSAVI
jgi:hypothetical protein